jgi:hypothetical protein
MGKLSLRTPGLYALPPPSPCCCVETAVCLHHTPFSRSTRSGWAWFVSHSVVAQCGLLPCLVLLLPCCMLAAARGAGQGVSTTTRGVHGCGTVWASLDMQVSHRYSELLRGPGPHHVGLWREPVAMQVGILGKYHVVVPRAPFLGRPAASYMYIPHSSTVRHKVFHRRCTWSACLCTR